MASGSARELAARQRTRATWAIGGLLAMSLVWTASQASHLGHLAARFDGVPAFAVALSINGVVFGSGLSLMIADLGLRARLLAPPRNPVIVVKRIRSSIISTFDGPRPSRLFLAGWVLNSVATVATGVVLTLATLWVLPRSAWGIAVLPVADVLFTLALRVPLSMKLRRAHRRSVKPLGRPRTDSGPGLS